MIYYAASRKFFDNYILDPFEINSCINLLNESDSFLRIQLKELSIWILIYFISCFNFFYNF